MNERKKTAVDSPPKLFRIEIEVSRKTYLIFAALLVIPYLVAAGFLLARTGWAAKLNFSSAPATPATNPNSPCHPGPWGDLSYIPIDIETPEEYLSVRAFEATDPRWFFGGHSREKLTELLDKAGLSASQKTQLLQAKWEVATNGIYLTAPDETVISLSPPSRQKIYTALAQFPENSSQQDVFFFPSENLQDFFAKSGASDKTIALVKQLCYAHGKLLFFADLPLVLKTLKTYEEKLRLAKAISRRHTMLLKLRVGPGSDVNALLNYWAKAGQEKDLRPMLEALAKLPSPTHISLMNLLPPMPAARLYSFPFPSLEPLEHDNCHWTSFNFFKDPPDNRFGDAKFIRQKLDVDFYPVFSDPRYGDLVFLAKASGDIIHSSVFIADNIVYTKNGGHFLSPWMLMTIPDMVDAFSAMLPADESLKVMYYRNKYY